MKILNKTRNTVIAENVEVADTFFTRFKGLLGRKEFPPNSALIIESCDSIHMFFMRFAIDAIFVDKDNKVLKVYSGLKPWRLSGIFPKASYCIELPSGIVLATRTQIGDTLFLQ